MGDIITRVQQLHRRGADLPSRLTLADQQRLLRGERLGDPKRRSRRQVPETPYPWATSGRTVTLVLPGYLPESLNAWGRNRGARIRAVSAALEAMVANYPELLKEPEERPLLKPFWRASFRLAMWFPTQRDRDPGNWDKAIKDALVRIRLLRGDSAKAIRLEPERFDCDPINFRTEITLTERERE